MPRLRRTSPEDPGWTRRRAGSGFVYLDENGDRPPEKDAGRWCLDIVNDYVREVTGLEATAKDFRTWHATVLAAAALAETDEPGETKASRKRAVAGAIRRSPSSSATRPRWRVRRTSTRG